MQEVWSTEPSARLTSCMQFERVSVAPVLFPNRRWRYIKNCIQLTVLMPSDVTVRERASGTFLQLSLWKLICGFIIHLMSAHMGCRVNVHKEFKSSLFLFKS